MKARSTWRMPFELLMREPLYAFEKSRWLIGSRGVGDFGNSVSRAACSVESAKIGK